MQRSPLERLAVVAGWVFIADFASKQWALKSLGTIGEGAAVAPGLHLAVVNNTRLAGGLHAGGLELQVTAIATILIALLVARICGQLTAVDSGAPLMLGLLAGSGAANLADALVPPHGVVDFIGITSARGVTITFNVADVALVFGLALCARTAWMIAEAMRAKRRLGAPQRMHRSTRSSAFTDPAAPVVLTFASARQRLLLSGGHALLAMCAFLWVYSMAVVWLPDGGRSAPNSMLCGVLVFAAAFAASQLKQRLDARHPATRGIAAAATTMERVVLDGSVAEIGMPGAPRSRDRSDPVHRRPELGDVAPRRAPRPPREVPPDLHNE